MNENYKNKQTLEKMYWEENKSQTEIAEHFQVDQSTVSYWMEKHEVKSREFGGSHRHHNEMLPNIRVGDGGHIEVRSGGKQFYLHRLLAVSEYGLNQIKGKVVHHKNHIPWDNRIENIELMENKEHTTLHRTKSA